MAGTPKLIVLSEQLRGKSFELVEDESIVGRTEDCAIPIPDPTISGCHCTIVRLEDGGFAVRDEGSTNGTRLNGEKLDANAVHALSNGDILQVGGVEMLFDSESSRSEGMSTQTVINLQDTDTGELPVTEMANLGGRLGRKAGGLERESRSTTMAIWIIIGVLGVVALGAVLFFIMRLLSA